MERIGAAREEVDVGCFARTREVGDILVGLRLGLAGKDLERDMGFETNDG
jgi:hypothetical protein